MCLTLPGRVISIDGNWAVVEHDGIRRRASILPAPEVRAGDWVIVAAGSVIRIVPAALAVEIADAISVARADPAQGQEGEIR
ncbi:MAG TPA: HypC/HybG/HupF family hydrogenase formation chaperone [Candidatus Limnocylindria bacterium]|nr:HypC/HybG/HupF family hydrogenase formation chaperone [Candidatus Limnocylindria bacterium]